LWHIRLVVETFAALAEPNRFRIVELLRKGPRPVNDIGDSLALNQPQVSKHLKILKDAGLVEVHPQAQHRVYALQPRPLEAMQEWLDRYHDLWHARLDGLDVVIAALKAKEAARGRKRRR
jgi:DNA-binding transcriptional ArsR family regulator